MARPIKKKIPAGKNNSRGRKRRSTPRATFNLGRLFFFVTLIFVFLITMGIVGYVIFFRVVVAAELPPDIGAVVFEEPDMVPGEEIGSPIALKDVDTEVKVAIIIDDMGYHHEVGEGLLDLDMVLTFSFLPYAPFTTELEERAYQLGRTVMLHLPLEPRNLQWDPGPGALYINMSPEERQILLDADLQQVPHATGVNNHMGSRYTESETLMNELITRLDERRLFFVDSYTTAESKGMMSAQKQGVPTSRRHVFLDNVQRRQDICRQIEILVERAEQQRGAIGIAHPYPETLDALKTCGTAILGRAALVGVGELVN